ncbi:DNA-binding helix-turn-helix protein [Leptospira kirschneri serovar Bulgarica str. Nikolaevo]|uniref:DNA-binding helix-turn-helix protein n=2 Tax=Leptospira kirschneri TaxID=29507 RepID=M6EZY4_9LEPT|nr:DNA-binding helix-turn-helix protein [Leptospira kirschneri serovar Bulgarica str. Nikolaevo]
MGSMFFKDSNFTKRNFLKNFFLIKEFKIKFLKSSEQTEVNISRKISEEEWKSFFSRLITARIEANLTQVQVAKSLGKYQSYISKIESGEKRLFMEDFVRLYKLYNKSPEYFFSVFSK